MPDFRSFSLRLLALLTLFALAPLSTRAQEVELAQPIAVKDDLATVFEKGSRLESERKWAEALSFYEDALRKHPSRTDLQQRISLSRAHYDVSRRYGDNSYTSALDQLRDRDALSIYDEVLLKIQSNYVHQPQWQQIIYSGLTNLEVALTEPVFVEKNLPGMPVAQLGSLQREIRQLTTAKKVEDRYQALAHVDSIGRALNDRYGLSGRAVVMEFASGAISALDEYSGFLTGSQMDEVFSQIEGNFVGLGIELKTEPAGLLIVNTIATGPAALGGIKPGDRIVAVDGKSTANVSPDTLADLLRGAEGSQVLVAVQNEAGGMRDLRLTRRRVEVPSVIDVKMIDREQGIGYFKLTSFQKTTSRDVDAALWKLHDEGLRHLIVDLRGNPGGLLKAAVDVADKFVMDGMIVATKGRSPRENFDHRGQIAGTWRVPLVVLIDHDSASASEIFAGAIRDHRRGTVVGVKSYGKGSVQGIFPLAAANVGVRLTTAKWYTPSGQAISGAGVSPDVVVPAAELEAGLTTVNRPVDGQIEAEPASDPILNAGLQVARTQLASRQAP
jgi:carboxyl-terminal processing protease